MRYPAIFLTLVIAVAAIAVACFAQTTSPTNTIDLFSGIKSGVLQAEFRGAGDNLVTGTIRSSNPQLSQMYIPGGTQFQGQQPGRQGMNSVQPQRYGLNSSGETKITIRTACTDIGLPAPTVADVMVPMPCPDQRIARLASVVEARSAAPEAVQIAVWAIANNPPPAALRPYLERSAPGVPAIAEPKRRELMNTVASLLRDAGVDPAGIAMFQSAPPAAQAPSRPNQRQRPDNRRAPTRTH